MRSAVYNSERRNLLRSLGLGGGGLAAKALIPGGIAAALTALLASPARADRALDVQILQTASSLRVLAVSTYGRPSVSISSRNPT